MDRVITIAMPTRNRLFCIDRVLLSVYSQMYPKNKTKLVFVDESNDGTYEKLLHWKEQYEREYLGIEVLKGESKGYISHARNICIAHMDGDIIFFWDSDVIAPNLDSLSNVIGFLEDESIAIAGFPYYTENPCLYERIMQAETVLGGMGFTAIKKEVFSKVGLFNEKLKVNEDTDLFSRARTHGLKIRFEGSTPGMHLRRQVVRSSAKNNIIDYKNRLKWSFSDQPFLYREMITAGSKSHLMRLLYYFALPIIIILWLVNFIVPVLSVIIASIFVVIYVLVNLCYHIWKAKQNRLWGVIAFAYHAPCGTAISYGYLVNLIRGFPKKRT